MSFLSIREIRQRLITTVAAGLGDGARHTTNYPGVFPRDAASVQHRAFSVSMPSTAAADGRRRMATASPGGGTFSETVIRIQWAWMLRVGSVSDDIDAASDSEQDVLDAIAKMDRTGIGVLVWQRTVRDPGGWTDDGPEYQVTTIEFTAPHLYDIGSRP